MPVVGSGRGCQAASRGGTFGPDGFIIVASQENKVSKPACIKKNCLHSSFMR